MNVYTNVNVYVGARASMHMYWCVSEYTYLYVFVYCSACMHKIHETYTYKDSVQNDTML